MGYDLNPKRETKYAGLDLQRQRWVNIMLHGCDEDGALVDEQGIKEAIRQHNEIAEQMRAINVKRGNVRTPATSQI